MLYCPSRRFLFVHIQKTGGESVSRLLRTSDLDLVRFDRRDQKHATLAEAAAFVPVACDDLRIWAMVRNPWDRLVSWYSMITDARRIPFWYARAKSRTGSHYRQSRGNPVWRYVYSNSGSFEEFLRNCTGTINLGASSTSFVRNQRDHLVGQNGTPSSLHAGRFERFSDEIEALRRELGLPSGTIPHENRSVHRDYRDYYTAETRELVARRYAVDIEEYGYEF